MDAIRPVAKPINRKTFFAGIRKMFGKEMFQTQVSGIEVILKEWELRKLTDLRHLAYMLATSFHETGTTMQPVVEWGKGAGKDYGKKLKRTRLPYSSPDKLYYGRGLVQLTWYENYEHMGKLLNLDLLSNPDLACLPYVAVKIMFEGMLKANSHFGDFTGVCLEMYFNEKTEDWIGARKIINGTDRAEKIAGYAKTFYQALAA
jgi:hypothetical protein